MERMWLSEARHKYPKQFIVIAKSDWVEHKLYGDIHMVTTDEAEAWKLVKKLRNEGAVDATIMNGYDDTPCIGGL